MSLCDIGSRDTRTHLSAAAAPKKAYVPGVMHGTSGWHTANMPALGYALTCSDQHIALCDTTCSITC